MNNSITVFNHSENAVETVMQAFETGQLFMNGFIKYLDTFLEPLPNAISAFLNAEHMNPAVKKEDFDDFQELMEWNLSLAEKNFRTGMEEFGRYSSSRINDWTQAWLDFAEGRDDGFRKFFQNESSSMKHLVTSIDKAVEDVEAHFGFKFHNRDMYRKITETERFYLYQILPSAEGVDVRENGKPVLLVPPYVLGPNILAFLPDEGRSYAHSFANKGIPTYIRVVKNINEHPAVQVMTGEDDVLDTRYFCEYLQNRHGKPVTLNGYCQGGFMAMTSMLTGELDNCVDSLITCVAPLDGTRSPGLTEFINSLPERYRSLEYAKKILDNGNAVIDGKLMGWVFKLKNMEKEAPVAIMLSDLKMIQGRPSESKPVPRIAAAINRWICGDRIDLPLEICRMSFASYTVPVDSEGNMPFDLFGRKLNIKHLENKGINFQICYAEKDDLVEKMSAIAPLDFINAEVTVFPKGHGAIATSWSKPDSPCPLDGEFNGFRGPVKFHLDMEEKLDSVISRNAA